MEEDKEEVIRIIRVIGVIEEDKEEVISHKSY